MQTFILLIQIQNEKYTCNRDLLVTEILRILPFSKHCNVFSDVDVLFSLYMIKINATRKKTIFLGWEWIQIKVKRDPAQRRGRDKTVFHPHSFNIPYNNTLLKLLC